VTELPILLSGNRRRSNALNNLALSYNFFGQPGRAVPLFQKAIELHEQDHDEINMQIVLSNLGYAYTQTAALLQAERSLRRALTLNRRSAELFQEGIILNDLGRALSLEHSSPYGCIALNRSARIFTSKSDHQWEGFVSACLAQSWIWLGNFAKASAYAERAQQL